MMRLLLATAFALLTVSSTLANSNDHENDAKMRGSKAKKAADPHELHDLGGRTYLLPEGTVAKNNDHESDAKMQGSKSKKGEAADPHELQDLGGRTYLLPEDKAYFERVLQDPRSSMDDAEIIRIDVPGMVIIPSQFSFVETEARLLAAIAARNLNIIAEIDHAENAIGVGLELDPNLLFIFGNPNVGTPLMALNRAVGLDLGQKMLLWQDADGNVFVGYNSPDYINFRHPGIENVDLANGNALEVIDGVLLNIASEATGVDANEITGESDSGDGIGLDGPGIFTEESDADFETTWNRLIAAIEASPAQVIEVIDHAARAEAAGLDLLPTRLVVFGNPNLGTPLMELEATTGIDLPLKILVWEDEEGAVYLTTNTVAFLEERHDLDGAGETLNQISGAINNFMSAGVGKEVVI